MGVVFFEIKKKLILDEMAGNYETLNQERCSLWPLVVVDFFQINKILFVTQLTIYHNTKITKEIVVHC